MNNEVICKALVVLQTPYTTLHCNSCLVESTLFHSFKECIQGINDCVPTNNLQYIEEWPSGQKSGKFFSYLI